jgi:hypothetical protein
MAKIKVKIPDDLYSSFVTLANATGKSVEDVVLQKLQSTSQFDNTTVEGVLRKLYYYQKKEYGYNEMTVKEFIEHWSKKKSFKKLWNNYVASGYDKKYCPSMFRYGTDTTPDRLYLTTQMTRAFDRDQVVIKLNKER